MKTALVTGSGKRRVGWHVAHALARRGYSLGIHYFRSATDAEETCAELKKLNVDAVAWQADVADEQQVQRLVEGFLAHYGRIDVLVNTAAIWERRPLEEVTAADVRRHFEVNALGSFLCCQHAGLAMCRQTEGGVIVNIGDWAEARPYVDYAAYFPSKGAVSVLTRSMAVELASRNPRVRVNCVLPGPVMLPDDLSPEERGEAIAGTLLKREGSPEHVARAVVHFVENEFVTGVCLPVDGGRLLQS